MSSLQHFDPPATTRHLLLVVGGVISVLLFFLLLSPSISSFYYYHHQPFSSPGVVFEDKMRLGSTPPSCHNKCNGCHPCMAVQVPTLPSHNRIEPGGSTLTKLESIDSYPNNRYSNYKPLGWKCRCGDHLYNP